MDMSFNNQIPPQGSATPANVVAPFTFISKGSFVQQIGNIPDKTGTNALTSWSNSTSDTQVEITVPVGFYPGAQENLKINDDNLVSENIMTPITILGVTGTGTGDATATAEDIKTGKTAYVNGVKITGTAP